MTDLLKEIKEQIAAQKLRLRCRTWVSSAKLATVLPRSKGLSDAMLNEMIDLGNGVTGLALNLERPNGVS